MVDTYVRNYNRPLSSHLLLGQGRYVVCPLALDSQTADIHCSRTMRAPIARRRRCTIHILQFLGIPKRMVIGNKL